MPTAMFCPSKISNVSYNELCCFVIEVCHVFFWVYQMWCGTWIHDKNFFVMLLVWCFCDKQFIIYNVFYDFVFGSFSCHFFLVAILFFMIGHFAIMLFSCYICSCCSLRFLSWYSSESLSLDFWVCCSYEVLVCLRLLYDNSISFVPVSLVISAGTLVLVFYVEGFFSFSWSSLSWLFVHLVNFCQKLVTDPPKCEKVIFTI